MSDVAQQTVVVFSGLPYSGKTAIIHRLKEVLPGEAVYVDVNFRDIVSEDEVCLERWLQENPILAERIIEHIRATPAERYYVEVGIMRKRYRERLLEWSRSAGYNVLPILLECNSREAVAARQLARAQALIVRPEKQKIAIDLDELHGPISDAFEEIEESEGYHVVDTCQPIEDNVMEIVALIEAGGADRGKI